MFEASRATRVKDPQDTMKPDPLKVYAENEDDS
jgi:hypothetical protein